MVKERMAYQRKKYAKKKKWDRDRFEPPCSLGLPFDDIFMFGIIISYHYPFQERCCHNFALSFGDSLIMHIMNEL